METDTLAVGRLKKIFQFGLLKSCTENTSLSHTAPLSDKLLYDKKDAHNGSFEVNKRSKLFDVWSDFSAY